jgi:hypothetical protein
MLRSRNLDDQTFDEIVARAVERLPGLAPSWTDYNAHDPGITILELLAWYKELQQYHLNFVGDKLKRKLLALAGVKAEPERAALCFVEIPQEAGYRAALERLETENGLYLELDEGSATPAALVSAYLSGAGENVDITHLLEQPDITVAPFSFGQESTELNIELAGGGPGETLRLWFDVSDELPVKRNPFSDAGQRPRELKYTSRGEKVELARDDTHALSQSGFIEFITPQDWNGGGALSITLADAGCEEQVRIAGIKLGLCAAYQRETRSKLTELTVMPGEASVRLGDALSRSGALFCFVREPGGLLQAEASRGEDGLIYVDAGSAADDGEANLFIVSADPLHAENLFFPSSGLPGMELQIPPRGRRVLRDGLTLICDTRNEEGGTRPALWRYTEDMSAAGPKERVFTLGGQSETLIFGDGKHGAVPPRGENAILLANFALSDCEGGNIPGGRARFTSDGFEVRHTPAAGGAAEKSVSGAASELLRSLENSSKCASETDYERAAKTTPGLRVAAAKAIAGYDPDEPSGRTSRPVVTVVVMPYGAELALPDARFLDAVRRHLDGLRPVCTKIKVVGPRHVSASIFASVLARRSEGLDRALREAAESCFGLSGERGVGDPVVRGDLIARIARVEGVYKVKKLEIRRLSRDCYLTPGQDAVIPRNAIAHLAEAEFEIELT